MEKTEELGLLKALLSNPNFKFDDIVVIKKQLTDVLNAVKDYYGENTPQNDEDFKAVQNQTDNSPLGDDED